MDATVKRDPRSINYVMVKDQQTVNTAVLACICPRCKKQIVVFAELVVDEWFSKWSDPGGAPHSHQPLSTN